MSENKLSQNLSLNFNELLKASIRLPVVKIDRDTFLRTELEKRYDDETICRAIEYNPAYANIPAAEIDLPQKVSKQKHYAFLPFLSLPVFLVVSH